VTRRAAAVVAVVTAIRSLDVDIMSSICVIFDNGIYLALGLTVVFGHLSNELGLTKCNATSRQVLHMKRSGMPFLPSHLV
jgi:hypothetical protein